MTLPEAFIRKYQAILGNQAEDFLASFEEEAVSAFRTNPLKAVQQSFPDPIPHTKWGYYGKVSGKSVEHVTGLVYSQEPAAQMVAQAADVKPGMRVLDLSAAPGGKSTHLLAYLNNQGILVSNDISSKRSRILVENIERFGARNVVVTNESAKGLSKVFNQYFDLIVFDGPCSGEGMFRKDPDAMDYWSLDYPSQCAKLQKEIIEDALPMLAPGGSFLYSTCTWSPEENEGVVEWLLKQFPHFYLEQIDLINGMQPGIKFPETARCYPHLFKGEGQFIAKFKDQRPAESKEVKAKKSKLTKEEAKLWESFCQEELTIDLPGHLETFGDQLYLLPEGLPDLKGVKIARNGLHLGTFKKNRFEPSFALGVALHSDEVGQGIDLNQEDFRTYMSGNVVALQKPVANGWYQVRCGGNGLGFAKVSQGVLKNYYPKGLRF